MYSLTHPIDARFYDGQNDKALARHRAGPEIVHLTPSPLAIALHFYQRLNSAGYTLVKSAFVKDPQSR